MRKLATIRVIDDITPIEGADAIECAHVGGWAVVVKKDEFQVGSAAIYIEIDSWIPHEIAPFLSKGHEPREFEGVKGERLRTVKLRGQISQGLLLKYQDFPKASAAFHKTRIVDPNNDDGRFDVTEILGIKKWEAPIPAELAGDVEGLFPSFIPKTDQERIQNLTAEIPQWNERALTWEATEKLDGSSMTVFVDRGGKFGVCSRNWHLRSSESNTLWRVAKQLDLENKLPLVRYPIALQGELIGEGVQKNRYGIKGHSFRLFDAYNIEEGRYLNSNERLHLAEHLGIPHAPILGYGTLESLIGTTVTANSLLIFAEAKSILNSAAEREGVVFKCIEDPSISFKSISNKFLIKNGE